MSLDHARCRKPMNALGTSFVFALACLLAPSGSFGQGIITGAISGSVVDPTGAVIAGAQVRAESDSTGIVLQVLTGAEGFFLIPDAPIGIYTVKVAARGFSQ